MISRRQIEIINGALLGDGYAEKRGHKTRIRFRQGIDHEGYISYLLAELKDLTKGKISEHWGRVPCYYFSTKSMSELNIFRDLFYDGRRRIIPKDFESRITPLSMAIWIMDDGHRSRGNMVLNTHRYSKRDQERVLSVLKSKYEIDGTINRDRNKYRILISANSTREILIPMVKGHIHDDFKYKIREGAS